MKKLLLIFLLWFPTQLLVNANGMLPQDQVQPDKTSTTIKSSHLEGIVEISFQINDSGAVEIQNIESTNPDLIDYVVAKMKKIKLEDTQNIKGKTIHYRFVFKKQI